MNQAERPRKPNHGQPGATGATPAGSMKRAQDRSTGGFGGLLLALGLAGCGAGGAGEPIPVGQDLPADSQDLMRFLTQATFGPDDFEVAYLGQAGFELWLERQRELPPSLHAPKLAALAAVGLPVYQQHREQLWWKLAIEAPDQLRQRMAFALSQILVISAENSSLFDDPLGCARYYDLLVAGAFGNYRDLLGQIALAPQMGLYLSMLKNQKQAPETDLRPDENFARELMQLFTIGLVELEPDGQPRLDAEGQPVPTYDQAQVEALARVFTGWTYAGASSWEWPTANHAPMENWPQFHDQGPKSLVGGLELPGGQAASLELDLALDALFEHQNVGPFLARRLIQRFVSSNPSPAYVTRVAAVFADDGSGERGDLWATLVALLLDPEARAPRADQAPGFGKLKEPLLRITGLWRAFDGRSQSGVYKAWYVDDELGQAPLRSPSVFNFFTPDYQPPGVLSQALLVAPEFQITDATRITETTNAFDRAIFQGYQGFAWATPDSVLMDLGDELALAGDIPELLEHLGLWLNAGPLSPELAEIVSEHLQSVPLDYGGLPPGTQRVLEALYLIATSPEASVQL